MMDSIFKVLVVLLLRCHPLILLLSLGHWPSNRSSAQERVEIEGHERRVFDISFSQDSEKIASVGMDGLVRSIKIWNIKDKKCLRTISFHHNDWPGHAGFVPSGDSLLFTCRKTRTEEWEVWLYDLKTGEKTRQWQLPAPDFIGGLWIDKNLVVAKTRDDSFPDTPYALRFIDLATKKITYTRFADPLNILAFSRDKKLLATEPERGTAKIYEVATGKKVAEISIHKDQCETSMFSPDNTMLLTVPKHFIERDVHFWDIKTGQQKYVRSVRTWIDKLADVTPDGRVMAAMMGGQIFFYDFETERFEASQWLRGMRKAYFYCLRFSPDGKSYATGSEDGIIRVFDLPKWEKKE